MNACPRRAARYLNSRSRQQDRSTPRLANLCTSEASSVTEAPNLTIEISLRCRPAWWCFRWYWREIYDRPSVPLKRKVRVLKTEVVETLCAV